MSTIYHLSLGNFQSVNKNIRFYFAKLKNMPKFANSFVNNKYDFYKFTY